MTKKLIKNYVYEGLGFPVTLRDVELIKINGEAIPKIDIREVADSAIKSLALQKSKLTGNQIKFIRTYFSMSLREFGKVVVNESHAAVRKWENTNNKPTNMDPNIEKGIRLYICDKIFIKNKNDKVKFYE
jgi:DNA-binding transcriptional regulator YiaG